MRIATILAVALLGATSLAGTEHAQAAIQHYQLNIPRQSLDTALKDLAQQTGLQIGRFSGRIDGSAMVGPVLGDQTPAQALKTLLNNTGLEYKIVSDTMIAVYNPKDATSAQFNSRLNGSEEAAGGEASSDSSDDANASKEAGKKTSQDFRLAQVDRGANSQSSAVGSNVSGTQENENKGGLEEIIVTAQKRQENLQNVPIPVTVLAANTLVANNEVRLQDYYASVPGLSVTPHVQSQQFLAIRGITTGSGNPTVGVTVDDVPYGSSTVNGGGLSVPDIDPGDLARIEELRGPQGTLYGASSMGGLLKFVTVDPSTDAVSGRVQAGTSGVYNGAEPGYNFRGSVNVPLSDTWAVRASGFTRQDPGYIDNPVLNIRGINEDHASGGRLSALWRPAELVSLKLSALYQDIKGDGSNDVDVPTAGYPQTAGLGDLQQNYVRGAGAYDRQTQAYSATLTANIGKVNVVAVSGYNINSFHDSWDDTYALGPTTEYGVPSTGFFGFGVTGSPQVDNNENRKFTQEVRLVAPINQHLEWLFGGFYTDEKSSYTQSYLAVDPSTGHVVGQSFHDSFPTTYSEYAAFTDLTYHITDRFDVQVGGRESHIDQSYSEVDTGPLVPDYYGVASPHVIPELHTNANAFTYLVTPRFELSTDLMVYARAASGYRAGGPNLSPGGVVPALYDPDKTQTYEIGTKDDFLEHRLSIDVSLYHIDWKSIQITLVNPVNFFSYTANGSQAKSQGVEFSVQSRPLTSLTIGAWLAWNDAKLTEPFPSGSSAYGASGDRLPFSSRFSANFTVEQDFPLAKDVIGFVGGTISYVGEREGVFTSSPQRQDLPAYAKTDLKSGIEYGYWTADLFATNVADKRGVVNGGIGDYPPFAFQYIQPRTVGINLSRKF